MERVTDEKLKIKRKRSRSDSRGRSKKHKHKSRKKHKRYYESSDSGLSGGSSPSPSPSRHRKKKKKDSKNKSKHKIRKEKKIVKTSGSTVEQKTDRLATKSSTSEPDGSKSDIAKLKASLPTTPGAQGSKARGPMTKEEYEKQQSVVRRVYDPDTGRHRLVKGDGEIIEEIVSRDRQRAINKQATMGDGLSFQAQMKKLL